MKIFISMTLLITVFFAGEILLAQSVAINADGSTPDASAMLDVSSSNKGFLAPRTSATENIQSPATGLLVYQTENPTGFYYYNGSDWIKIGSASDATQWTTNGSTIYYNSGNVGIGTTTPTATLHVQGGIKATGLDLGLTDSEGSITYIDMLVGYNDLRLYGDNSSGDPDILINANGMVGIGTSGNAALIDLAIGDTDTGLEQVSDGELAIYTNNNERVRINIDGNVGIGTTAPAIDLAIGDTDTGIKWNSDGSLSIYGNNSPRIFVKDNGEIGIGTTTTAHPLHMASGAYVTTGGAWTNASDARLKTNIINTSYGLQTVMQLRPVNYTMRKGGEAQVGFLAQEVQKIVPEVVSGTEGDIEKGETLGLSYGNLVPVLTKAIQEQQKQIDELKQMVNELLKK